MSKTANQAINYAAMSAKKTASHWIKQLKATGKLPTASATALAAI
ncbi:MAG: hypothetical protein U1D25_20000 [Hydrogenophaga sp.]|nr:hypothetical protein [Hydrogenophaga sp.]MDZ4190375.1 hypothetical protein [Hydrogenophaga sp.]